MKKRQAGPKGPATPVQTPATSGDVAGIAFDPFLATFEEARRLQERCEVSSPQGPLFQWVEAQRLIERRPYIEGGRGFDVLDAVAGCALHGLVMPDWLAAVFLKRYREVQRLRVNSWDAESAFGKPYPDNFQVGTRRHRVHQRLEVWLLVTDYVQRHPAAALDPLWQAFAARPKHAELLAVPHEFSERARRIGCGKSKAQELYREACGLEMPDHQALRARLLPASSEEIAGSQGQP